MHLDSYYLMTCIYVYNVMYIKESRDAFDKKNTYENVDSLLVKFTNKVSTKYVINIYI